MYVNSNRLETHYDRIINALRQELLVVTQQLRDERERNQALEDELQDRLNAEEQRHANNEKQALSERDDLNSRFVPDDLDEVDDTNDRALSSAAFRASKNFPYRYVPPLDFLPPIFVDEFLDVIEIIDRYAQLYHRHHVGGCGGVADPSLTLSENDAVRSHIQLLEAKLEKMNTSLKEKDEVIDRLGLQIAAWRSNPSSSKRKLTDAGGDLDDDEKRAQGHPAPFSREIANFGDVDDALATSDPTAASGAPAPTHTSRRAARKSPSPHRHSPSSREMPAPHRSAPIFGGGRGARDAGRQGRPLAGRYRDDAAPAQQSSTMDDRRPPPAGLPDLLSLYTTPASSLHDPMSNSAYLPLNASEKRDVSPSRPLILLPPEIALQYLGSSQQPTVSWSDANH